VLMVQRPRLDVQAVRSNKAEDGQPALEDASLLGEPASYSRPRRREPERGERPSGEDM